MANFQEASIVKAHTLSTYVSDKVLEAQISPCLIVRDVSEGEHPFRMGLRDPTSPVVGHCALVLMT
jgi:hypothetical protein